MWVLIYIFEYLFCCNYYREEINYKSKLMRQCNVCAKSFDYDGFTSYIKLENSLYVENKSSRELQFLVPFSVPTVVQHNGLKLRQERFEVNVIPERFVANLTRY